MHFYATSLAGMSATAIAAGYHFTCAIVTGGGIKCWGRNGYGQLGIGSTTDQRSPVIVPGAERILLTEAFSDE